MKTVASVLLLFMSTAAVHAQTPQSNAPVSACKKSSGINVFVELDARPTVFTSNSKQAHIAPALSPDFVSRLESKLNAQGFCVYHNDEFDSAGNTAPLVAEGTSPHVEISFLAHVISFPESEEILVYCMHFGDWETVPSLPYYLLNDKSDIAKLSEDLAHYITSFTNK